MNWFSLLRRLRDFRKRPLSKKRFPARPLGLEALEDRAVPAQAPIVTFVDPGTGGNLAGQITVKFSENVDGAELASNFLLYAQDGTLANIANVTYDSMTFTTTIQASDL